MGRIQLCALIHPFPFCESRVGDVAARVSQRKCEKESEDVEG